MSKAIIAKKIGMTQIFAEDGRVIPVTVLEAGPCPVVQVKTEETDGYAALKLGFGYIASKGKKQDEKHEYLNYGISRPDYGQFRKAGVQPCKVLAASKATRAATSSRQTCSPQASGSTSRA